MSVELLTDVRGLLDATASAHSADPSAAHEIDTVARRLEGPLIVAIAGKVKAGKSTLLNALVRERLAPTDAGECTKVVSEYRNGLTYSVEATGRDGSRHPLRFSRESGELDVDLDGLDVADIDRLVIEWPSASLADTTLIDTPGIASLSPDASIRALAYLTPDDEQATEADAVVYLMRHLHATDRNFLEAFHDRDLGQASPVNTVAVLSRADEIGVGRLDAMASARQIADRYATDPQIRRLCQTVIPVAGLIAEASATLRQDEYQALADLAGADRRAVDRLLVSVDRFTAEDMETGLGPEERRYLLARFGLYGVRIAVALVRQGAVASAPELAAELARRSGIDDLRRLLDTVFTGRRDVLKARAALLHLESVIARHGDPDGRLEAELERIWANAHEIAELRLLSSLRSGRVPFDEGTVAELERAIGAEGVALPTRLGLAEDASADELPPRAHELIGTWRTAQGHPLTSADQRQALDVAIRSVERIVAALPPATGSGG